MNFNQISLCITLTLLLASKFVNGQSNLYSVHIMVHNYTVDGQHTDGSCTENIDTLLTTYCGSTHYDSDIKSDDSCSDVLNKEYTYTSDECSTSDSFYFKVTAKNDCGVNIWSVILEDCGWDNSYTLAMFVSNDIADFECGWNGPYIQQSSSGATFDGDKVAYSLYKPCEPTSEPTPSPTAPDSELTFTICIDADYTVSTTDDADQIQVRLWTDNELYQPTEWRNLTSDSTLFSTSGTCHTFSIFNDIYAQWYLMDFSTCSTDGIGITRILYWDMETESQQMVSSFDGDSECIKINGDFIMLDGDSYEGSHTHSTTSDTTCQRLSVNLSYYSTTTQVTGQADVVDQTETTQFDDATDDCTSL